MHMWIWGISKSYSGGGYWEVNCKPQTLLGSRVLILVIQPKSEFKILQKWILKQARVDRLLLLMGFLIFTPGVWQVACTVSWQTLLQGIWLCSLKEKWVSSCLFRDFPVPSLVHWCPLCLKVRSTQKNPVLWGSYKQGYFQVTLLSIFLQLGFWGSSQCV